MGSRIEPGDGRIITAVKISAPSTVKDSPAPVIDKELIADTGGMTAIPLNNLKPLFGTTGISLGPMQQSNFGPMYEVLGASMEVEVQLPDGTSEVRRCPKMMGHLLPDGVFLSGDGLLGMDQFDSVAADPVKDKTGTHAYLRART